MNVCDICDGRVTALKRVVHGVDLDLCDEHSDQLSEALKLAIHIFKSEVKFSRLQRDEFMSRLQARVAYPLDGES